MSNLPNINDSLGDFGPSVFKGGILGYAGRRILGFFMTFLSFGLLYPWSVVLIKKWEINNTYINGRRLKFTGTATGLFGQYILWWFLTFITFGIYGFWLHIKMRQWIVRNTHFE